MSRRPLLLLLLCAAGCTILRSEIGSPVAWDDSLFEEGETHYRAVLEELGAPLRVGRYADGVAFLYEYFYVKEGQIGLSYNGEELGVDYQWLEWIKFSFGRGSADRQALVMIFDGGGTLQSESFVSWDQDLGSGFSLQFIVEAGSVVDTSSVRTWVDPNEWGQMMLRPLPQTLNAPQSIDDGRFGIEQRGTPDRAGQRALEMRREETPGIIPFLGGG